MSGDLDPVLDGQTIKQPVWWMCGNPECRPNPLSALTEMFVFASDYPECPKCGCKGPPAVQKRALIHLMQPNPIGPIAGQWKRFQLACDRTREHIATLNNGESATDQVQLVNCPGCKASDYGTMKLKEHASKVLLGQ